MSFRSGITPHFLQPVKLPVFGKHDVNDHIHIIDQDPLQVRISLVMVGAFAALFFYFLLHMLGNGPDLWLVTRFTDDKKIGHRFIYFTQVKGNDMLPFFFLDGCKNGFDDF